MKKIAFSATIILGLCIPTPSNCNFVHKKQPYTGKSMGIIGSLISVASYIALLKVTTTRLQKTNLPNGNYSFVPITLDYDAILHSCTFLGCGLFLTCFNIHERYKLKRWNQRTSDQVYQEAQLTHNHISFQLAQLYAITGKTIDATVPFAVTQKMIMDLQRLPNLNDTSTTRTSYLPLNNIVQFINSSHSVLDDHTKTVQQRIDRYKNQEHASTPPAEWTEFVAQCTQDINSMKAIKEFIQQSLEYRVEMLRLTNGPRS